MWPLVYVVGLTGPMGAGKSAVLEMFRELGAKCLRADDASRELLANDMRLLSEIRRRLGDGVFHADGSLDRKGTAALIFRDPEARQALEDIVHEPMLDWLRARLDGFRRQDCPPEITVVEAAILTHMGARSLADVVVLARASREELLQRIAKRDGISLTQAEERLATQEAMGLHDQPADHVLDTSGSLEQTRERVNELWAKLQAEARQRAT